jgi:hypothetical protein
MPNIPDIRLICVPFRAVYDNSFGFTPWTGDNAILAAALLFTPVRLWPIRASIFSLVDVGLRVGDATYAPGEYPPLVGAPMAGGRNSIYFVAMEDVHLLDVGNGSTITGELFMPPLILAPHLRDGVLVAPVKAKA